MKKLLLLVCLLFLNCTQIMFVSNPKELWRLGIPNCRIVRIEKVDSGTSEVIFMVTYKKKECQDINYEE